MTSLVGETLFISLEETCIGTVIEERECKILCRSSCYNCYGKQVNVLFHGSFTIDGFYCSYKYRFKKMKENKGKYREKDNSTTAE